MVRRTAAAFATTAIMFALIGPVHAGGGGHMCTSKPRVSDRSATTVGMEKFCYSPIVTRVQPGDKVTWVNRDPMPHAITAPGNWGGGFTEFAEDERVSFRFDDEGVFPYSCLLHPGMTGVVVVGDGITNKDDGLASIEKVDAAAPLRDTALPPEEPAGSRQFPTVAVLAIGALVLAAGATALAIRRRASSGAAPLSADAR